MHLQAYIENYGDTLFTLEVGGVYKFTANEKLDSFNCNIVHLEQKLDLRPFQYVKIIDSDNESFELTFVIDSFDEKFVNFNGKYYEYQINLMSPTKILEKIIIPNRTYKKSKVDTPKTIGEIIGEYCDLYIPRVKKVASDTTWEYAPFIEYSHLINEPIFSQECPDLSWGTPSLRTVLTTLMLVVGCLPKIVGYTLSYFNLRQNKNELTLPSDRQYFIKSNNSSDSYINTLYAPIKNLLDDNNSVVNEIIGFRDINNVLLKQAENLVLTTDFPIERVLKLETSFPSLLETEIVLPIGSNNVRLSWSGSTLTIENIESEPITITRIVSSAFADGNESLHTYIGDIVGHTDNEYDTTINPSLSDTFSITNATTHKFIAVYYTTNDIEYVKYTPNYNPETTKFYQYALPKFDITDFVMEKTKREQLETDYTLISDLDNTSFEDKPRDTLTSNFYTTLEYTYNSNTIRGFSNKWSWFNWYGEYTYVFIDALCKWLYKNNNSNAYLTLFEQLGIASATSVNCKYQEISGAYFQKIPELLGQTAMSPYACFTFNITYVPFNDTTLRYHKDLELALQLEQADTQESSITMFNAFTEREQEKVNRLGNNIYYISQPSASLSSVEMLSSDNLLKYTYSNKELDIFQQEIQFYSEFVDCNYVASEHYIMQNYFTALQTKYRAYEYVSLKDSVERKENVHTYIRVGRDYLAYASDKIYCLKSGFLGCALGDKNTYALKYAYEISNYYDASGTAQTNGAFKKDLSVIASGRSVAVSYRELDNQGFGTYIRNYKNMGGYITYLNTHDAVVTEYNPVDSDTFYRIGGTIQGWYIHKDFDTEHKVSFQNESFILQEQMINGTTITNYMLLMGATPLNNDYDYTKDIFRLRNQLTSIMSEDDDTPTSRVYYKSLDERINETIQFEYYTNESDIKIGKLFSEATALKNHNYSLFARWQNTQEFNENMHTGISALASFEIIDTSNNFARRCNVAKFEINATFQGSKYLVLSIRDNDTMLGADIFMFDYTKGNTFYFSLNDTRTDRVYEQNATSGLYELSRQAKTNDDTRKLVVIE